MSLAAMLAKCASQVGYVEGGGYNGRSGNLTKYGAWYGMNGAPYCDMGLSWAAAQVGESAAVGKFAYCPSHESWFRNRGQWGQAPRVGALVFFSFGSRESIHIGIVEKVLAGRIQTIEFNTSSSNAGSQNNGGGVYRRVRTSSWGIRGYGYPKYGASRVVTGGVSRDTNRNGLLAVDGKFGGNTIRETQKWIGVAADGDWGPKSKRALQRKVGAKQDGVIGKTTISRLQKIIGARVDGGWGPATTRALQAYLNRH